MQNILVIKLGALGDFVQSMGAFKAIRSHHRDAKITLMTTKPFEQMAKDCGYFDHIWIDNRRPFWDLLAVKRVRNFFRDNRFNRVYDLQCVSRTEKYFHYLYPKPIPQWSGTASGASHIHPKIERAKLHTYDRYKKQLGIAGISPVGDPALDWVQSDITRFNLPEKYALLIPGAAPGGEKKIWPAESFIALAQKLIESGITPILIGGKSEEKVSKTILESNENIISLVGETSLYDIVELARKARFAIGGDTGPSHMIAQSKCPILVLFSNHSDPKLFGPRGDHVHIVQKDQISDISVDEVLETIQHLYV